MPNVRQLKDHGDPIFPITHVSLVKGMEYRALMDATYAWDGTGAPDVSKIPAGVVVTYDGTDYTGTLVASASTTGRFYLVPSTTVQGEWDRYMTDGSGSSYAWKAAGNTSIPSPNVVDNETTDDPTRPHSAAGGKRLKDQVDELEHEVNTLSGWYYGVFAVEEDLPDDATRIGFAFVGGNEPLKLYDFDGEEWGDTGIRISGITGPQGVGVDSIEQTTESTASGGVNIITITLSNGDTQTFAIRNGGRGLPGAQGQQGNPGSSQDYPFSLENSLLSTDTTKALTAAMGKILNDTKAGINSDVDDVDLKVMDDLGNVLAEFVDGHFRVKYFDTKEINKNTVPVTGATADEDFSICDPLFNKLLILADGHIKTKYFDSSKLPNKAIKKAVFMGDSITQGVYSYWNGGVHSDANRYNGFDITNVSSVEQSTEFHGIHYYFGQFSGAEMVNLGKRGSGWVADTRNIGNALAVANSYNYSNVDFVALFFGVNDYIQGVEIGEIGQSGTVRGNMASVIQKIASDNPLCKIVVYSPYNTFGQVSKGGDYVASDTLYGDESTNYALGYDYMGEGTLSDYIAAIDDVCAYYGVQHVKLSASNVVNRLTIKNIMIDGLHPSKESYPMLAAEIYGKGNFGA